MSLFNVGNRPRECILVVVLIISILYTNQISMMHSYWINTGISELQGGINEIIESVGPVGQGLLQSALSLENEETMLQAEFAKFRQRDLELDMHSANNSFSSCLIIMDENHRLTEWLAYHIFTLPLRHLVVANDPRSLTDPNIVFDKFQRLGVKIEVWSDSDFGFKKDWQSAEQNGNIKSLTKIHRGRQSFFYKKCSNYLKTQNKSWTTFHDVDEYIVLDKHYINNTETLLQQPGSILKWFQEAQQAKPIGVPEQYWTKDCITLSRTMYGTQPSNISETEKDVPEFVNASKFETLTYRHHEAHNHRRNGACKSLVDVQKVGPNTQYGVHAVMGRDHCGDMHVRSGPLAINHYVGSWEYFSYKNDSRGVRREDWEWKSTAGKVRNDDEIRPWIGGFVDYFGKHLAKYLLADAGYIAPLL